MSTVLACPPSIPVISDAQVRSYVENGYLVVPDLVSSDERERLLVDLVRLARGGYPCATLPPVPATMSDDQALQRHLCLHQPHHLSPVMRAFMAHPGLVAVLRRVVAAHLAPGWWDGAVKCMQSMFFVKPPGKQGQAWHQDEVYIPTRDRSLCGAWIAVDDATIDNGCLWVLPGSHRSGYLWPMRPHGRPDEFDSAGECHGFDDRDEVPVEVAAGSVVFFNGYLLHRSRRNRSDRYRRALVNHYMNAWSLLPWFGRDTNQWPEGDDAVARLDHRGIVTVAGSDPYAWKGTRTTPAEVHSRRFAGDGRDDASRRADA